MTGCERRLPDEWQNGASDDVPIAADRDRDHRLNVEYALHVFQRADMQIRIFLDGKTDQITDRILRNLRQILGTQVSPGIGEGQARQQYR